MSGTRIGRPSQVTIAGVDLTLTRKRVRNVNIRIRPDGEVRMSAPVRVPLSELERIVSEREPWIRRTQAKVLARSAAQGGDYGDGQTIALWGRPLTITHIAAQGTRNHAPGRCHVSPEEPNTLVMELGPELAGSDGWAAVARGRLVDAFYRSQLEEEATRALARCEPVVGRRASGLRYRKMKTRWGSCNVATAMITLNTQLAAYPLPCLDYVVTHELCHLHEPSHNARFHGLMDGFCPDWRERRARLNEGPLVPPS